MKFKEAFTGIYLSKHEFLHVSHYIKIKVFPRHTEASSPFIRIITNGHEGVEFYENEEEDFKEAITYIQKQLFNEIEALSNFSGVSFEDLATNHIVSEVIDG